MQKKWKKKGDTKPELKIRAKEEKKEKERVPDPKHPKGNDHLQLPTGEVLTDPVRGTFSAIPLIGYMSVRHHVQTPLVMLIVSLIDNEGTGKGLLRMELPYYSKSEKATVAALERFGWDGRVWPPRQIVSEIKTVDEPTWPPRREGEKVPVVTESEFDQGWPAEDQEAQEYLEPLLQMMKLIRTFTFPPNGGQCKAQQIEVTRAMGPFLMNPLPEPEQDPDPKLTESLKQILSEGVSLFYQT